MAKKDWETDGTRNGANIYCTVNAYGDCPYCDQMNICHIKDPIADCDDFALFFSDWEEWERADSYNPDDDLFTDDYVGEEIGFNPFIGGYDYDC